MNGAMLCLFHGPVSRRPWGSFLFSSRVRGEEEEVYVIAWERKRKSKKHNRQREEKREEETRESERATSSPLLREAEGRGEGSTPDFFFFTFLSRLPRSPETLPPPPARKKPEVRKGAGSSFCPLLSVLGEEEEEEAAEMRREGKERERERERVRKEVTGGFRF